TGEAAALSRSRWRILPGRGTSSRSSTIWPPGAPRRGEAAGGVAAAVASTAVRSRLVRCVDAAYRRSMSGRADSSARTPAYTHGYGAAVLDSHRARTAQNSAAHLLPHLRPGQQLLDVGSGAGTITADLARIVGSRNVAAAQASEQAAEITRAELARQGLGAVRVLVGDAQALPLAEDSVDVVHAHQVLQHLPHPVTAIAEARRVTRPGGIIAL